jgi:TctA family transporter
MSQGSLLILFTRPIAGVISAVAVFFFLLPLITPYWRRLRPGGEAPGAAPRR